MSITIATLNILEETRKHANNVQIFKAVLKSLQLHFFPREKYFERYRDRLYFLLASKILKMATVVKPLRTQVAKTVDRAGKYRVSQRNQLRCDLYNTLKRYATRDSRLIKFLGLLPAVSSACEHAPSSLRSRHEVNTYSRVPRHRSAVRVTSQPNFDGINFALSGRTTAEIDE